MVQKSFLILPHRNPLYSFLVWTCAWEQNLTVYEWLAETRLLHFNRYPVATAPTFFRGTISLRPFPYISLTSQSAYWFSLPSPFGALTHHLNIASSSFQMREPSSEWIGLSKSVVLSIGSAFLLLLLLLRLLSMRFAPCGCTLMGHRGSAGYTRCYLLFCHTTVGVTCSWFGTVWKESEIYMSYSIPA